MGQCQWCHGPREDMGQETGIKPHGSPGDRHLYYDSDSALDSSQSGNDDPSCEPKEAASLSCHSSQSSGKYSLRESVISCGECAKVEYPPRAAPVDPVPGSPVSDDNEKVTEDWANVQCEDALTPLRSTRTSRDSTDSDRGCISPAAPLPGDLKATLGRSISLKLQRTTPRSEILNSCSWMQSAEPKQTHRSISLKLPRTKSRPRSFSAKLPTIYVDDVEQSDRHHREQDLPRKISLNRALSLLSVNSLPRQEGQKPVQKILRQPRRRHNTVRGMSGMAIDASNQAGRHRYYPTNTSLRFPPPHINTLDF